MNVTYGYSSQITPVEMYSGMPVLYTGDSITAYITGATPGGAVRRHVWSRNPTTPEVGQPPVIGYVGSDGNFVDSYVVQSSGDRRMYGSNYTIDDWTVQSSGAWNGDFNYVTGVWSHEQIASSPFTTANSELPKTSPYSVDVTRVGVVNPPPPPVNFDVTKQVVKTNVSDSTAGQITATRGNSVNDVSAGVVNSVSNFVDNVVPSATGYGNYILLGGAVLVGYFILRSK